MVQVVGAVLVLVGFAGAQSGRLSPQSAGYLVPNLAGSAILAAEAVADADWGFVLLEVTWAVVSLAGLVSLLRRRRAGSGSAAG